MSENGYPNAAFLTKVIRQWYEASDNSGMAATQRVEYLLNMRNFILEGVDFSTFPPPGRYIKGIPIVSFEGMLMDIDSKLQMYAIAGTYNIRTIGSLAAETTVGVLQSLYPTNQVSIKARDVPSLMATVVEVMTCKLNPNRGFRMRTSRTSGVYPLHYGERNISEEESRSNYATMGQSVDPKDHAFDYGDRQRVQRRIKFGNIAEPMAPSRGALPVRQWHRKDESKILPTKKLGLTAHDINLLN